MNKADLLAASLDEFLDVSPDVEAAAVVSTDGLPIASALPPYVEEDRLAAMSAALLTLGERAASGRGKGSLAQVFVEGEHGHVVLMSAGDSAVLVAVTSGEAKVGLTLYEMRKTVAQISQHMDSTPSSEPGPVQEDIVEKSSADMVAAIEPTTPPLSTTWGPPPAAPEAEPVSSWQ